MEKASECPSEDSTSQNFTTANRSSLESGANGPQVNSNMDEGGVVKSGKQRRRMSNTMEALDLDLQAKRRQVDGDKRNSMGSDLGMPNWGQSSAGSSTTAETMSTMGGRESDIFWPLTSTEQFMSKHMCKVQLTQFIQRMEHAFPFLNVTSAGSTWRDSIQHGLKELNDAIDDAWRRPLGPDLAMGMADHLRHTTVLDTICKIFIDDKLKLRQEAGRTIENYFSDKNRNYIFQQTWFKKFLSVLLYKSQFDDQSVESRERRRLSASLLDFLIRNGPDACTRVVHSGGLDFLLRTFLWEWSNGDGWDEWDTLRNIASALCNLSVLGGRDIRKSMVDKNIPSWMFVLLSHEDTRIRFYACLIVGVIANEHDLEAAVEESQTLPVVVTFLQSNRPSDVAPLDVKFRYGRSKAWLSVISSMLRSTRPEVQALACFQQAKEAYIRQRTQNGLETIYQVFEEVGSLPTLKEIASSPLNQLAAEFAGQVLKIVGERVPKKLNQSVPIWSVEDVEFWVTQIGFGEYSSQFVQYRVDGDLLLRTSDRLLLNEIGMKSEYERMRFMRELDSLKKSADYNCVDPTRLDVWMMGLDKDLSVYSYAMLMGGIDRRTLIHVDENVLRNEAGIQNAVHRMKILHAVREVKHVDELDIAILRKHVDIFICYRRSTGSQLASLLKVHLQLRGYKVFIDVDRLYAGQFDTSLLKNIRAAKHFVLVLSQHALDRCLNDHACKDWVHLEIRTALESGRNIVPVQDKSFVWPDVNTLPVDIRPIAFFNAVQWVHEYQEACVEKLDKFLKGEHGSAQDGSGAAPIGNDGHGSLGVSRHSTQSTQSSTMTEHNLPETAPHITKQHSDSGIYGGALKRAVTTGGRVESV